MAIADTSFTLSSLGGVIELLQDPRCIVFVRQLKQRDFILVFVRILESSSLPIDLYWPRLIDLAEPSLLQA